MPPHTMLDMNTLLWLHVLKYNAFTLSSFGVFMYYILDLSLCELSCCMLMLVQYILYELLKDPTGKFFFCMFYTVNFVQELFAKLVCAIMVDNCLHNHNHMRIM